MYFDNIVIGDGNILGVCVIFGIWLFFDMFWFGWIGGGEFVLLLVVEVLLVFDDLLFLFFVVGGESGCVGGLLVFKDGLGDVLWIFFNVLFFCV